MTCQPVCGPARACIQTGKYPTAIGCEVNDRMLPLEEKGIASYFHEAGYETAYVGKWHLASHHSSGRGPARDYKTKPIRPSTGAGTRTSGCGGRAGVYLTRVRGVHVRRGGKQAGVHRLPADATTDFALEYLRKPKEKPFFLFVSYIEPHHQNDRNRFEGPEGSRERYSGFPVPGDLEGTGATGGSRCRTT